MTNKYDYVEVKAYTTPIYPGKASEIINQGVKGVLSGSSISKNAKKLFDEAGVWYRDNVEPKHLEIESTETESGE